MSGTIQGKDEREGLSRGRSPVRHIAIVDDDESVRRALVRLLAGCSFNVRTFPSGVEFLESLKGTTPDCLILDLQMPDMTGLEVLHQLAGAGFSFPVIVVTAQDELGILSRCKLAGAAAFLTKPFMMEPLLQALAAALGVDAESVLQSK